MRIGAVFPTGEIGGDAAAIRAWAQGVEELGYDHIFAFDHLFGFRDNPAQTAVRPQTAAGAGTRRCCCSASARGSPNERSSPPVFLAPRYVRRFWCVSKRLELDVLSGGRLRLGLAVGSKRRESDASNENYENRGRRIEEQIAVLRALWTEEAVTFAGEWQRLDGAGLTPRPVQRAIPIWLGGMSDRAIERAARLADGWMPLPMEPDEEARAIVERFRRHADRCGRAPDSLGLEACRLVPEVPTERWRQLRDGRQQLGATHLTVLTYGAGLGSADEHAVGSRKHQVRPGPLNRSRRWRNVVKQFGN